MYSGPAAGQSGTGEEMEGYLLGKRRVDGLLKGTLEKPSNEASFKAPQNASPAVATRDIASKIKLDPMLAIKAREQEAYEAMMNDPVKRRALMKASGKEDGEDKRRRHHHRHDDRHPSRHHSRRHHDEDRHRRRRHRSPSPYRSRRSPSPSKSRRSPSPYRSKRSPSPYRSKRPQSSPIRRRSPPPSQDDRAASLAAMQQDASALDQDRVRRLAALAAQEQSEREADNAARERNVRYGGRGDFVHGLHRQAGDIGLAERMQSKRSGMEREQEAY